MGTNRKKMELNEFQKALAKAASEKKLVVGTERALKLAKAGNAALVAFCSNCPEKQKSAVRATGVGVFEFAGTNFEFGEICKKPFAVSCMAIMK